MLNIYVFLGGILMKMLRRFSLLRISSILMPAMIFCLLTCRNNVGLGGRVDIERPSGDFVYPDSGETPIRGSFVLKKAMPAMMTE